MEFSDSDILYACTNPKELHLIVLPTEKCNFRCLYCYEDHDVGRMSEETVGALALFLEKAIPTLTHLTIDWFGGEPLLGLSIIRKINGLAKSLSDRKTPQLFFRSGVTTNAYLLRPEVFAELSALNVNQYQVTLDGLRSQHDKTRIRTDGGGSFDTIWQNLLAMRDTTFAFDVLLRLHLTSQNLSQMPQLVAEVEREFGGDERFKLFLKPIKNLGGSGSSYAKEVGLTNGDEVAARLEETLVTRKPFWHPNAVCHASKFNSLIIRSSGAIAKCTTALNDPINNIGQLKNDGTLDIRRDVVLKWSRGVFGMDKDELYCPYGGIHKSSSNDEATSDGGAVAQRASAPAIAQIKGIPVVVAY